METHASQETGNKIMRILQFTVTISMMSALMFVIALPQISEEFGLTLAEVSWLSSAYGLIYAIGVVTYGKLADRYRLKTLLTFGLLVFAAGSLIGLTSQTFWLALLGRCLQASGAAVVPAAAMLIPIRYFAPERRGAALGMVAVGLALGSALGPVVSSLIISFVHWRWLFAVSLLILITVPFYRKYLGDEQLGETGKFDWIGGGLLAITVALFLLSVTNGAGWSIMGGLVTLVLFILRVRSASLPFVQPKLFKNRMYTIGLMISFLINGIGCSLYFLSPLLLSDIQELPTIWIGIGMIPAAIASAIMGRKGGKLADLRGNSYLIYIASGLLMTCFILLSTFAGSPLLYIAGFLILGNVGQSFIQIAMSNSVSRTLPKEQAGVGMGMFAMLNFISQAMATGVYSRIVDFGSSDVPNLNPAYVYSNGSIYSNIFLVLAACQVAILGFYYFQFGRIKKQQPVGKVVVHSQ